MNKIINVRGTNGSGKTTLARALMSKLAHYKDYTTSNGVFTHVYRLPNGEYLSVFGQYDKNVNGGTDKVRNVRDLVPACVEVAPYSHIFMEGLILSGLQQLAKDIADACAPWATMHLFTLSTSKEQCIQQVLKRRELAGKDYKPYDPAKTLLPKYRAVELAAEKFKLWGMDSRVESQQETLRQICGLLNVPYTPGTAL